MFIFQDTGVCITCGIGSNLQKAICNYTSLSYYCNGSNLQKALHFPVILLRFLFFLLFQEQEKCDLLESYRALSDEAEKLDSTAQHSLGETSSAKMEIAALSQVESLCYPQLNLDMRPDSD